METYNKGYFKAGTYNDVLMVKRCKRLPTKNKTIWGYDKVKGRVKFSDIKARISYMVDLIENSKMEPRERAFAVHHLKYLRRQLKAWPFKAA